MSIPMTTKNRNSVREMITMLSSCRAMQLSEIMPQNGAIIVNWNGEKMMEKQMTVILVQIKLIVIANLKIKVHVPTK